MPSSRPSSSEITARSRQVLPPGGMLAASCGVTVTVRPPFRKADAATGSDEVSPCQLYAHLTRGADRRSGTVIV